MQCAKNQPYELLKNGIVGGPSAELCRYQESGKSRFLNYTDAKVSPKSWALLLIHFTYTAPDKRCLAKTKS